MTDLQSDAPREKAGLARSALFREGKSACTMMRAAVENRLSIYTAKLYHA
jgi:hypothetical protein